MKSIEQVVTEFMSYESRRIFSLAQVRNMVDDVARELKEVDCMISITPERKEKAVRQIMIMQKMRINSRVGK